MKPIPAGEPSLTFPTSEPRYRFLMTIVDIGIPTIYDCPIRWLTPIAVTLFHSFTIEPLFIVVGPVIGPLLTPDYSSDRNRWPHIRAVLTGYRYLTDRRDRQIRHSIPLRCRWPFVEHYDDDRWLTCRPALWNQWPILDNSNDHHSSMPWPAIDPIQNLVDRWPFLFYSSWLRGNISPLPFDWNVQASLVFDGDSIVQAWRHSLTEIKWWVFRYDDICLVPRPTFWPICCSWNSISFAMTILVPTFSDVVHSYFIHSDVPIEDSSSPFMLSNLMEEAYLHSTGMVTIPGGRSRGPFDRYPIQWLFDWPHSISDRCRFPFDSFRHT